MSIITKALSKEVSKKLLTQKLDLVKYESLKLSEFLYDCWIKSLPKQVLDCFREYPQYFSQGNTMRLEGNGFSRIEIVTPRKASVIYKLGACYLDLTVEDADIAKKLHNNFLDKEREYNKNVFQIESALLSLRSYKAIEKHFPEAMKFLPNQVKLEVAINFEELRQIVKP